MGKECGVPQCPPATDDWRLRRGLSGTTIILATDSARSGMKDQQIRHF
jgi:hypothetical protein